MPGFQSFFRFVLHHFVFAKLATSSKRVNEVRMWFPFSIGSLPHCNSKEHPADYLSDMSLTKVYILKIRLRFKLFKSSP